MFPKYTVTDDDCNCILRSVCQSNCLPFSLHLEMKWAEQINVGNFWRLKDHKVKFDETVPTY